MTTSLTQLAQMLGRQQARKAEQLRVLCQKRCGPLVPGLESGRAAPRWSPARGQRPAEHAASSAIRRRRRGDDSPAEREREEREREEQQLAAFASANSCCGR